MSGLLKLFRKSKTDLIGEISGWGVILFFSLLSLIMLYPLSLNLGDMVPEPTDPLLNAWRMQWNVRAFLSGPESIRRLFDANIFYPFPLTLAYSEHFLMISALALPFLLLAESHLFGMNLSVVLTFILSGYGMYLLVVAWSGNRWAGLVAGTLFAFSPHRFGQLNHLELLVTQWMPLTLLALHWTLTRPGRRYPLLFVVFFNLQALSGFHFGLNLTIACLLLTLAYALTRRIQWRFGLWLAGGISLLLTLILNGPIWRVYLRFSDIMGAVRTPGEVRIYSAALTDYLTAIPYNFLYGWSFGYWQSEGHQFQPLMPLGLVGLLLALLAIYDLRFTILSRSSSRAAAGGWGTPALLFLLTLTLLALLLSFGLNEKALGPDLAPLLERSPYVWLYRSVPVFQGIRVPGRYGILVVLGLVGLAGWGLARIYRISTFRRYSLPLLLLLLGLILLESWSVPLVGPRFPAGEDIPPVYAWLRENSEAEAVVLELPFQGASEFLYEYYASYHWRRLANGGTGFTPPIYKELRRWFNTFPSPQAMDIIQQLGIDWVILHADSYDPASWQQLRSDLARYWPVIDRVEQIGDSLALRIARPGCRPDPARVGVSLGPADLDGWPNALAVTYHNDNPTAFVADVMQVSRLTFGGESLENFTEPLVTPAGQQQKVVVPLAAGQSFPAVTGLWLASLNRSLTADEARSGTPPVSATGSEVWQPLGLQFAAGPELVAYQLVPERPQPCSRLALALQWQGGQSDDAALIQLLDPFGRIVSEHAAYPWQSEGPDTIERRTLPMLATLPPGQYGLRVLVKAADGQVRPPVTADGVTIPPDQIPPLPLLIQPAGNPVDPAEPSLAQFNGQVTLLDSQVHQTAAQGGDWLRFSLVWRLERPLDTELTVFTQLIGPAGQVWGQEDNQPGGGWYRFPLWPAGQAVADHHAFQIQPDAPPGLYRLIVGLYQSDTLERLSTSAGRDFVEIGLIEIE